MTQGLLSLLRRRVLALAASLSTPSLARGQADATDTGTTAMHLRVTFANQDVTATLEDSLSARDLVSMLFLDLTITDHSTNEKIAYLLRRLTKDGSSPFGHEAPGDLCYFAPWGNLAFFHAGYRWPRGLIRLGRLDEGTEPLPVRGEFPLWVTLA